jgi:hypothetical protein
MAYYAFLDNNNIVTEIITGKNEDEENIDWEQHYGQIRKQTCKRTSYNTKSGVHYDSTTNQPSADQSKAFRKNFAGIGYIYDENLDAFIPPRPYFSWVLNENTCQWQPPIPMPDDNKPYIWVDKTLSWIALPS